MTYRLKQRWRTAAQATQQQIETIHAQAVQAVDPRKKASDSDYVFVTFILEHLPHGLVGLLIAAFFAAALSSKAAELNALASATTVDLYRHIINPQANDGNCLRIKVVYRALGDGGNFLRAIRSVIGKLNSSGQHCGFDFLSGHAGNVHAGFLFTVDRWNGGFLGWVGRAAAGDRSLFFARHQLPLV